MYTEARHFSSELKRTVLGKFPSEERFGLRSQIFRSLDSVILNIAEGCARNSDKDFAHFLTIANGSLNETVACLDIAQDCGYLAGSDVDPVVETAAKLSNQLTAFRKRLLETPSKTSSAVRSQESAVRFY